MKNVILSLKAISLVFGAIYPVNLLALSTDAKPEIVPPQTDTIVLAKAGTSNGGGGGVYKLPNGQLVTLPEFGILIRDKVTQTSTTGRVYPRPPQVYIPSKEVEENLKRIQQLMKAQFPTVKLTRDSNPSPLDKKLILKTDVDAANYERIKLEYRVVLEAFGYRLEDDKFILPAYSENGITYILPDFTDLNDMQKAKILIHEAKMREKNQDRIGLLITALKIDSLIQEVAFANQKQQLDKFSLLKRMYKVGMVNDQGIFHHIFLSLVSEMKGRVPVEQFIEDSPRGYESFYLDPSFIQELQIKNNLKTNYAEMFEGTSIFFSTTRSAFQENKHRACPNGDDSSYAFVKDEYSYAAVEWQDYDVVIARCRIKLDLGTVFMKAPGPFIQSLLGD